MKKLSIYLMAFLSIGLVACTENFDPEVGPQSNLPESLLQTSDVSVSSTIPNTIKIADYINSETPIPIGVPTVKEGAMPANTTLKADVQFSRTPDFSEMITIPSNSLEESNEISISAEALQNAYFSEITKNPNTTDLYVRTILYTVTNGDAVAIVGKPGENYYTEKTVSFTPLNLLEIAPAYYIVGGPNDWAGSAADRSIKFQHSDEDVYIDPVFTVTFDAAKEGDTWFAIGDDKACDAVGNGDWNQLFGIVGGDNQAKEGKIARRSELGGDNSFCVPAGAKKIRVTIDMMEQTFKVEAVNIADSYYLIGDMGTWGNDKSLKFSHSDKDVFDDPVFTYVFAGGKDMWFAFGDAAALDAIDAGDWNQLFGTKGASEDMSGSFDRRSNLGGDHSFHVDGSAKFYRFQINALDMTYTITPLNFEPFIYYIGATDGWANAEQKLALTDDGGIYTGYIYCADPNGWGNEFKFQRVAGSWDNEINFGTFSGGVSGDFVAGGGGNIKANAGEGVYYIEANLATGTLKGVKVNTMGIIGDFNGWGGDVVMTWNATDYCFEAPNAGVNANGWKFRVNSDWGINLGGNDSVEPSANISDLVANGKNLGVAGSTIKLYPTRKTSDKIYCTVE